jgi:hypothetical protein
MLTERTVVSKMEITESAAIQLRIEMQVVKDGRVISAEYHRTIIEPGVDAADQIAAVNRNLKRMGYEPLADHEVERVKRVADIEHTPEVVQAFNGLRAVHEEIVAAKSVYAEAFKANPASPATKAAAEAIARAEAKAEPAYVNILETVRRKP